MQRLALFGIVLTLIVGGGGLVAFAPGAQDHSTQRQRAQELWKAQPLKNYRIAIIANVLGTTCSQELEVRDGTVVNTIEDSCKRTWLGPLTVDQLFNWSERLEAPMECAPSFLDCVCRWVRVSAIDYHPQLGYPQRIDIRRSIQANVLSPGYWKRALRMQNFSTCSTVPRRFQVAVVSLTSLP